MAIIIPSSKTYERQKPKVRIGNEGIFQIFKGVPQGKRARSPF